MMLFIVLRDVPAAAQDLQRAREAYERGDKQTIIPLPAALPLYGTGLAVMGFMGWRRKSKAAA